MSGAGKVDNKGCLVVGGYGSKVKQLMAHIKHKRAYTFADTTLTSCAIAPCGETRVFNNMGWERRASIATPDLKTRN